MIQKTMGAQSLAFTEAPCIISSASVVGKKESEGPLGDLFDVAGEGDLFGEKTWEEAESRIQKEACVLALGKAHVGPDQVRCLYGGDLLRQGIATSMGAEELRDTHVRTVWRLLHLRGGAGPGGGPSKRAGQPPFPKKLLGWVSQVKNGVVSPEGPEEEALFAAYEQGLKDLGVTDFDGLLNRALAVKELPPRHGVVLPPAGGRVPGCERPAI